MREFISTMIKNAVIYSIVIPYIIFFLSSCESKNTSSDKELIRSHVEEKKKSVSSKNQEEDEFIEFISNFRELKFPIEINKSDSLRYKRLFSSRDEINRKDVLKYLFNGDSSMIIQPTGGFYTFNYGYKLEFDKSDVITLLYLRNSYDCYSGLIISTHKRSGGFINSLFIL